MSDIVQGSVAIVSQHASGNWNVKLDDGSWYGAGFNQPACKKGDEVQFEVKANGRYLNMVDGSLEVIGEAPQRPAPRPQQQGGYQKKPFNGGGKKPFVRDESKEKYWQDKSKQDLHTQAEIRHQAARNAAIAVISMAVANNLIAFPETTKKGAKFETLMTYVDKVTQDFFTATTAIGAPVEVVKDAAPEPVARPARKVVAKPAPAAEEDAAPDFSDLEDEAEFE